jgi:hypothetical protein
MFTEAAICIGALSLGLVALRDAIGLAKGVPAYLRSGPIVFRASANVDVPVSKVPDPVILPGWLQLRSPIWRVSAHEVGFIAPVMNGPLLKGVLAYLPETQQFVVTGRPVWGIYPLFLLGGGALAWFGHALGPLLLGAMAVSVAWSYVGETARFKEVLRQAVHGLGHP